MLEELYSRKSYTKEVAEKIEEMGAIAVSVANRWMLGWSERVMALLQAGIYLEKLQAQVEVEKEVLENSAKMTHLARWEVLQMFEVKESPPMIAG